MKLFWWSIQFVFNSLCSWSFCVANLKMSRNSLKTSASSWSSSTSLIIAFNVKWFWGAPSFSIMYWILQCVSQRWECLCNFHLELIETNFLGLLATIFLELLLQILDLLPVIVSTSSQTTVFQVGYIRREIRVQFCLIPLQPAWCCQVAGHRLWRVLKHNIENREGPWPWEFCKLQVDICPMTLLHWCCFSFIHIWAGKEYICQYFIWIGIGK